MYRNPEAVKQGVEIVSKTLSELTPEDAAEVFISAKKLMTEKVGKATEEIATRGKELREFYDQHLKP